MKKLLQLVRRAGARMLDKTPDGETQSGMHRAGPLYIPYDLTIRRGRPLVVVLPAVDGVPGQNKASYYSFHKLLDASVLSITDNIGAHGCYFLSQVQGSNLLDEVAALIERIVAQLGIPDESLHLVGTSKGGTIALCLAMVLGRGQVISGEPQVMLGNFLYGPGWETNERSRGLSYAIKGRINPADTNDLNKIVKRVIWTRGQGFRGRLDVLHGSGTGYLRRHLNGLPTAFASVGITPDQWSFHEVAITSHSDIARPFVEVVKARIPVLQP